jgi:hypothetical protein
MSERVDVQANLREGSDHLSGNPNLAPAPNQPFTEMTDLLAAQAASAEPELLKVPVALKALGAHEWRFRTTPGRNGASIRLDIPVESDDTDDNLKRKNKYKRWLDRQVKQGRIDKKEVVNKDGFYGLKADKDVYDLTGEYVLIFTPVRQPGGRRAMEAQYVTHEKVIADYIRGRLNRGDFAGEIYEEVRPVAVEINGQTVYMMPADDNARQAMAAAAAGD